MRQTSLDKLTYLVGGPENLLHGNETPALVSFSREAIGFLSALSTEIMRDPRSRALADVVSYAYWIRKSSLFSAKDRYGGFGRRMGRGVALHFAPSNVPVNFAVSMTSSLLAGNATVVRVSNKQFEQVDIICDAANRLLSEGFAHMVPYLTIVRYGHDSEITQELSSLCDVRVIWGGDATISEIRESSLPARAIELTFSDRHSIAIIDSDEYLKRNPLEVAKGFYTDTYYTDQNACSSPRLVCWMGENIEEARARFWPALEERVELEGYEMQPVVAVEKYAAACSLAMDRHGVRLHGGNVVMRVEVDKLTADLMDYKRAGGLFFEYELKDPSELVPVLGKRCQTVSVLGVEGGDVLDMVLASGVRGVDRIVPLGETMGLEFIWDGYMMIEAMSRIVYLNG